MNPKWIKMSIFFFFREIKNEEWKHFCFSFLFLKNLKRKVPGQLFRFPIRFLRNQKRKSRTFLFCINGFWEISNEKWKTIGRKYTVTRTYHAYNLVRWAHIRLHQTYRLRSNLKSQKVEWYMKLNSIMKQKFWTVVLNSLRQYVSWVETLCVQRRIDISNVVLLFSVILNQ